MTTATEYLAARGFDKKTAQHFGFVERGSIHTMKEAGAASASIEIPYFHPVTGDVEHLRWRILNPAVRRDNAKFLQKKKEIGAATGARLWFPRLNRNARRTWAKILKEPSIKISVTEGEFKAAKATIEGILTLGIGGKDCALTGGELIPDWKLVELQGRSVELIPDFDFSYKKAVKRSWLKFADALVAAGAVVTIKLLHDVTGTGMCGLDDFLHAAGRDAFDAIQSYAMDSAIVARWREELGEAPSLPEMKLDPVPGEWLEDALPPKEFLVESILLEGIVALQVAAGGAGKTNLAMRLSMAVATGENFFGHKTRKSKVVYLALEDPADVLRRRLFHIYRNLLEAVRFRKDVGREKAIGKSARENLVVTSLVGAQLHLIGVDRGVAVQAPAIDALIAKLKEHGTELLVLDPLARLHGANENDNAVATAFINSVERIAREVGCTILINHHVGKANAKEKNAGSYAARGASGFSDAARAVFNLMVLDDEEAMKVVNVTDEERKFGIVRLVNSKANYSMKAADIWMKRDQYGDFEVFTPEFRDSPKGADALLEKLCAWHATHPAPFSVSKVVQNRDVIFGKSALSKDTSRKFMNEAIERGALVKAGKVNGGDTYTLASAAVPND